MSCDDEKGIWKSKTVIFFDKSVHVTQVSQNCLHALLFEVTKITMILLNIVLKILKGLSTMNQSILQLSVINLIKTKEMYVKKW